MTHSPEKDAPTPAAVEHDEWCDANGCRCGKCPCLGAPWCIIPPGSGDAPTDPSKAVMGERNSRHHPLCDVNLGPDFEVEPGVVRMTLFVCLGECWDEHKDTPAERPLTTHEGPRLPKQTRGLSVPRSGQDRLSSLTSRSRMRCHSERRGGCGSEPTQPGKAE